MNLNLELAVNSLSFGNCSILILRRLYELGIKPNLFLIGGQCDLSSQSNLSQDFVNYIQDSSSQSLKYYKNHYPLVKLWHLNGSHTSISNKQYLYTFYECSAPTQEELNIASNCEKVIFSEPRSAQLFKDAGLNNVEVIPLAFDKFNFHRKEKVFFDDNRVTFNIVGKAEILRKNHQKVIRALCKKYGNKPGIFINCAIYNNFFKPEDNQALFAGIVENKRYFNLQFFNFMATNQLYNEFLNSGDIVIGMGSESWGLPEMHSVAIGKHAVLLNYGGFKAWGNGDNAVMVEPHGTKECHDGMFFHRGANFNQGVFPDFNEDEFLNACDMAIERVRKNKLNIKGLELQEKFSYDKTVDGILNFVKYGK